MAKANPFRFSTKYQDDESDLLCYGYRSYNPTLGRWLNRDPIGERGGGTLYAVVENNPISRIDALGLRTCKVRIKAAHFSEFEGIFQNFLAVMVGDSPKCDAVGYIGCAAIRLNSLLGNKGIPGMPQNGLQGVVVPQRILDVLDSIGAAHNDLQSPAEPSAFPEQGLAAAKRLAEERCG